VLTCKTAGVWTISAVVDMPPDQADLETLATRPGGNPFPIAESPEHFFTITRGKGVRESYSLQCLDKKTGQLTTIDAETGDPLNYVTSLLWHNNKLYVTTDKGLVRIDALHLPAAPPAGRQPD
jgi:hypothetical protein